MGGLSKRQRSVEVNQHRHSVISRVSTTMGVKKTIWVEFPNKEENLSHLYQKHISGNCTNALIKTCAFSGSTPSSERGNRKVFSCRKTAVFFRKLKNSEQRPKNIRMGIWVNRFVGGTISRKSSTPGPNVKARV